MDRKELLNQVKDYFANSDHWRRLCAALAVDPDPQGSHLHAYVETSVHPDSLEAIITGYFEKLGWPSTRRIDHMAPKPGMGSLHGIEPKGKPHFDFQWFFNKDVGIRPCEGGESGCNLLVWNRWYINRFYEKFPFRQVGSQEEKTLDAYFRSEHFLKGLDIATQSTTNHMHINVRTSVHPEVIQKFAEAALDREGWKFDYTCPNVYMVKGNYQGKLVFMCRNPEVVFDIGWKFDPGVIIEPAMETWIFEENPGYDVWTSDMLAEVMRADYVRLSGEEIQQVLEACFPG
ncbi:hypothetical protein [Thermodesulforhabdus norvegica]|uniref:Uncharacterized protein n=1 Tax=Thermodesulforhabdus norvegica TaxID=39841 RepID=A0A1I4R535_9BACT|nr:hypothetical protein [Thermodesulforhabdus norvegica]SFM47050.1 hypothetical protein SAMN05660836_00388 [Thermodesulforhabdus norvegica]